MAAKRIGVIGAVALVEFQGKGGGEIGGYNGYGESIPCGQTKYYKQQKTKITNNQKNTKKMVVTFRDFANRRF